MKRRLGSMTGLIFGAVILTVALPVWFPIVVLIDACRLRWRFPLARLLSFAVCWAWLETVGVVCSAFYWLTGQSKNLTKHYALQRWWADRLLAALKATCGFSVEVEEIEALQPGPILMFARHASLADSLVSAYVVTTLAQMKPRYVLKRELLADPCLDVVGQRLPNHFLDRNATDSTPELQALEALVTDIDVSTVGIIFPEGTRANEKKRKRAIEKIALIDSSRADRLHDMKHLLPPRPAGAAAMLRGCPSADVVFAWHVGFEGLDTFGGILRAISSRMPPIRFHLRRVERTGIPSNSITDTDELTKWLDSEWMRMDREVDEALKARHEMRRNHRG
jgi:1-acyl-sn-glycerol-3-phosphate acyltransferase